MTVDMGRADEERDVGRPRGRVRLYLAARAAWHRAGALLAALHDGLWLGVLRRDDLYRLDDAFYRRSASYAGDAHNLRGLFPWEEEALEAEFGGCTKLLVLAAGGGREVLALVRRGFEVEAYECNPALVDAAAELLPRHGCDASVRLLARDRAPEGAEPFDGIILGWSAYTLIPGRAHRVALLRALRPRLRPGGPLLLSFFTRAVDGPRFRVATAVANAVGAVTRRGERVETGDALSPNFVHYFTAAEVAGELREAGFEPRRYAPHGSGGRDSGWAVGARTNESD